MPKPSTPSVWASGKSFGFTPSLSQQAQGFDYIATVRPGTGAPITDDHDWPLNQITSALAWVLDSGFGYGSAMIGVPIPWPLAVMPQDIWPDIGMVFLASAGQSFSAATYPKLALAYPALALPDLRAEFIRGWDNGRGVDAGRQLLSWMPDSLKAHAHTLTGWGRDSFDTTGGDLFHGMDTPAPGTNETLDFPVSGGGTETAPRNISFNYIVRAS